MEELEDTAQEDSRWVQMAVQVTATARIWMTSQRESKHSSWLPPVVPDPTHGMPQRAVCQDIMEAEDQDIQGKPQLRRHPVWEQHRVRVT